MYAHQSSSYNRGISYYRGCNRGIGWQDNKHHSHILTYLLIYLKSSCFLSLIQPMRGKKLLGVT